MDPNRRTSAVHLRDSSDAAAGAAGAATAAPTAAEEAEEALSIPLLPSSSYSTATPAGSLPPRRHKRRGSSASAARETAGGAAAPLPPSGAQKRSGGSGGARPLASSPAASADASRGSRHYHARSSSGGGGTATSSNGSSAAAPAAASDGRRRLLRRTQRLLWAFWRRRRALAASLLGARSEIGGLSRPARHPWGRRLAAAGAVLLAAAFWFAVIVAVAGPATGGGGAAGDNNKEGASAKGSGGDGDKDAAGVSRSYYRRVPGESAVGPSLADPWMVRDIEIAAADWGLEGGGGGGDASSEDDVGGDAAEIDSMQGVAGSLGLERRSGKRGTEWDGRVNSIVMGELEPVGTAKTRPKVDLLLTIFSGTTKADAEKRELLRQIYDKYEGWVKVGGPDSLTEGTNPEPREFSVSVVFVMSKETAPPEGELVGDILYVSVPEGYRNIVLKTKAMLCLVRHFDFEFLLKADDDSFVCLTRIASMLHDLDPEISGKVYAGVPTACNQSTNPDYWNGRVMKNPDHRWFDSKYVQHTLGGLDCFPAYMQGAFYILAQPLVEHLYRGHEHLECFTNEDVTIGSWLMGVSTTCMP
ncbi:unnamed protein product [Ectocarpus fasciculatus]